MSQVLEVFGVNWKLLLIQGVNFGILLFALWYFLYKPVLAMIDERRAKIAHGVKSAEKAEAELKAASGRGQQMVSNAAKEAEVLLATAREQAETKGQDIVRGAQSRADNLYAEALERAEEAKRSVMKESEKEIARAAILAAEKILRKQ